MQTESRLFHAEIPRAILGWLCIILFFVVVNTTSVYNQMSGSIPANAPAALPVHCLGILFSALAFSPVRRALAGGGAKGLWCGAAFLLMLLAPTAIFMFLPLLNPGQTLRAGLGAYLYLFTSGFFLAMAMQAFLSNVPQRCHALFFGVAAGLAYAFWAMLMPLLGDARELSTAMAQRWVFLLYLIRCAAGLALALTVWLLRREPPADGQEAPGQIRPETNRSEYARAISLLLLPVLTSSALSGLLGYKLSFRLLAMGDYPEYMPLALAVLFPLAAAFVHIKGEKALYALLSAGLLCCALCVPLLFISEKNGYSSIAYTIGAAGHQLVLFASLLAFARLYMQGRKSPLLVCLPWLACVATLPAALLWRDVLEYFSVAREPLIWGLGGLAMMAAPLTRLAFPLPSSLPGGSARSVASAGREGQDAADPLLRARLFAESHRLTRREREILELLLQGRSTEDMSCALGIKESSTRRYINSLLHKAGAASRLELVAALAFPDSSRS